MVSASHITQQVPPSEIRKIYNAANGLADIVHLEIGDPDFATPAHIIEAAHAGMLSGATHYTPTAGTMELREAIADKFSRENGIKCDPGSEVIATVGAVGAIYLACMAVLNPGDEVLVPDPNWPNYDAQIILARGAIVRYSLREEFGFAPDVGEIKSKITPRTKVIILNSPNNPTGSVTDRETLMAIGRIAVEHDILVISDEVYEHIIYEGYQHFSLASIEEFRGYVLTVNALSKTYAMTGWRLGYACGPGEVIAGMIKVQEASASCVSAVIQKAAVSALNAPQECVAVMMQAYAKRREMIVDGLNEIPGFICRKPQGAFYVFPNIKAFGMDSYEFAISVLNEARVAVVHGSGLGVFGEGYVRISYSTSEANLREGLARLKAYALKRLG